MKSLNNSRVFVWKAFSEWKLSIEDMFKYILTPELTAKVKRNATSIESRDNQTECEEFIGKSFDSIISYQKIDEFRQVYPHIRTYHACRPINVDSYYQRGILILSKDIQVERFRSIFLTGKFPELTEDVLQMCIKKAAPYSVGNNGELCLAIDDRHLIELCGHYLVYGSEYLSRLVTKLPFNNIDKYRFVLRDLGKPTIIKVDIPNVTEHLSDPEIYTLFSRMIMEWLYITAHPKEASCHFDYTLSFRESIQPEHIHSHYHPVKIPDPFTGYKIYNVKTGEYEEQNSEEKF